MANNLSAFIPELWSRSLIKNIDQVNIGMNFANRNYEGEIRQFGDTVHVRTFGNITLTAYTRNATIVDQDLAPVDETLVINDAEYFSFKVDDLDRAQNDINARDGYTVRAGVAMSNYLDSFIFAAATLANAANKIDAFTVPVTADGAAAIYLSIIKAGLALDKLNVPQQGRWLVVTPYVKSLLLQSTTYFIRASQLGDQIVSTSRFNGASASNTMGYMGQIASFDVWESNNLPIVGGTHKACLFGQGQPISFAAQIAPGTVEALRLETTFATRVRGLMLQGKAVFAEDSKRLGYIEVLNS